MKQFINLQLNPLQLEQVNRGLTNGVNINLYSDPAFSWEHMECIRLLLQDKIDPTPILNPQLTYDEWTMISQTLYEADMVNG